MEEGKLPKICNGIGAVLSFISAVLGGVLQFPGRFLPGVTFPAGVGFFLVYLVMTHHPPSWAVPKKELPAVFGAIYEGKKSGLAIGIIFTLASGIPAHRFFLLQEIREAASMLVLCIGIIVSCIAGTLVDMGEIKRALERAD